MCGRFAQVFVDTQVDRIKAILMAMHDAPDLFPESFNIAPTQNATIGAHTPHPPHTPDDTPTLFQARFGLVPSWANDQSSVPMMNNARSETVRDKPAFRDLINTHRCIIPITGFYEWSPIQGERHKQPWYISRQDDQPMLVAGLWDTWGDPHNPLRSFSILTRESVGLMDTIHHRMPIILEPDETKAWLNQTTPNQTINHTLTQTPKNILKAHPISRRVNSVTNNDPTLLEQVQTEDQGFLF